MVLEGKVGSRSELGNVEDSEVKALIDASEHVDEAAQANKC